MGEQTGKEDAVFVGGLLRIGCDAPMGDKRGPREDPPHDVGIPDVDGE